MDIAFNILFVAALSCNIFPLTIGLKANNENTVSRLLVYAFGFGLVMGLFYFLGSLLGSKVMYLIARYVIFVVFALFLMIGVRMLIEALKVRKGIRSFDLFGAASFFMIAFVASINAFFIGLGAPYFENLGFKMPLWIALATSGWAFASMQLSFSRINIVLASFLQFISALIFIVLGFIYLILHI
jgi:putative Mn2+ efflux pump MntP